MSRKARVAFSYDAEQEDEISLQVGDIITNIVDKDTGWCEGELNGKRGMFPNNFVEEFFSDGEEAVAPIKADSVAGKKGKVTFDYDAANEDELTLHVDDVVDILGEDEEGWWKGRLHGRTGVFPSNFVEIVQDTTQTNLMLEEKPENIRHHDMKMLTTSNEDVDREDGDDKRHSGILPSKKLPGGAVGFGNLINPGMLAKRLNKVHHDEKKEEKNEKIEVEKSTLNIGLKSAKMRPAPPVPVTPQTKKTPERVKVICDYDPQDRDELRMRVGDIILVINKEVADTEGWWEGELGGKVGVFPNNFVELLSSEQDASAKDKPPDLPATSKKGVPVLPTKIEGIKPTSQEKHASPLPPEHKKELLVTLEQHPLEKPAIKKPPVKKEKPSLPPKKPLPGRKAEAFKKPEKKVDDKEGTDEKSKANDDHNEAGDVRLRKISKEEDVSQAVTIRPPSRTEDVREGDISFDGIPETETLNHLTANRAKNPQKRPPSKDGRLTDSTRLSGHLEEQLFNSEHVSTETHKRSPGRPKEPPKEPAWKREAREARENKVPPATTRKDEPVEKKKSQRDEVHVPVPSASKREAAASVSSADAEKLNKQIAELREAITNMEKKHNEAMKQLEEKFNREIESLTNDFDEERKQNAALKVELDRIKRRQARLDATESK